jgi:hypothetical protein
VTADADRAILKREFLWIKDIREKFWDRTANCYLHPGGYPMTWDTGETAERLMRESPARFAAVYAKDAGGSPMNTGVVGKTELVRPSSFPIQLSLLGEPPTSCIKRRGRRIPALISF